MKCDFASTKVHIHAGTEIKITIRIDDPLCKDEPLFFWEVRTACISNTSIKRQYQILSKFQDTLYIILCISKLARF